MTAAPATAPATIVTPNIKALIDGIDNMVDTFKGFPFVGTVSSEIALFLDPLRTAVDAGGLQGIKTTVDTLDAQIDTWAKEPFIGSFLTPLSTLFDNIRIMVDKALATA